MGSVLSRILSVVLCISRSFDALDLFKKTLMTRSVSIYLPTALKYMSLHIVPEMSGCLSVVPALGILSIHLSVCLSKFRALSYSSFEYH